MYTVAGRQIGSHWVRHSQHHLHHSNEFCTDHCSSYSSPLQPSLQSLVAHSPTQSLDHQRRPTHPRSTHRVKTRRSLFSTLHGIDINPRRTGLIYYSGSFYRASKPRTRRLRRSIEEVPTSGVCTKSWAVHKLRIAAGREGPASNRKG
jgi:hypothetical protein